MKTIKKLKIDELCEKFVPLTNEEIRKLMGGWYCFAYCMNYIGVDGARFEHYYDSIYGSSQANDGVSSAYVESALNYAGISYINYDGSSITSIQPNRRQIVSINNGTHAVIYEGFYRDANNNPMIKCYDKQDGTRESYAITGNSISMIGF